jgi:hypothetical protein
MDHLLTWLHSSHLHGWDTDFIGYFASAPVLATFLMKSMIPLRVTALMSNVAFIYYAITVDIRPILILHSILLPVNICRLTQILIGRPRPDIMRNTEPVRRSYFFEWLHGPGGGSRRPLPCAPVTEQNACSSP